MAKVTIGGRELDVKPATVGFWERMVELGEKTAKQELPLPEVISGTVQMILEAVGHNKDVTERWLRDNLVFPPTAEYRAVVVASGLVKAEEPPAGESAAQ